MSESASGPSRGVRGAVLAVDGGNSKVDAVLVGRGGEVLGAGRWTGHADATTDGAPLESLADAIRGASGDDGGARPIAAVGVYCLAGADFPSDERRMARALERAGFTRRTLVRNDTFAVLRAGTDRGWGVAVVCGAGMNCLGLGPDGRTARFAAIGPLSGDMAAGGEWVGLAALGAAIRARDGRGPRTVLERVVPEHFGASRPETVMRAMHLRRIPPSRLMELPPAVFAAAGDGDVVARRILDQLADEVVAMATGAIRRLRLQRSDLDVVLGGGVFRGGDTAFIGRVESGILGVAANANVLTLRPPPVLGAALIGLDEIGTSGRAASRLRAALDDSRIEGGGQGRPARREV